VVQSVERSETIDCNADSIGTPAQGPLVAKLRWPLGTIGPGQTTQVRMHYRRW
jgi:hypothetical protein